MLGVDDVAKRKGRSYATVLMDMDTHRLIDMLPDREAETFADWLRARRGIEVICRDRGGAYARASREAAPAAVQVADRFHLWRTWPRRWRRPRLACLAALPAPRPGQPAGPGTRGSRRRRRRRDASRTGSATCTATSGAWSPGTGNATPRSRRCAPRAALSARSPGAWSLNRNTVVKFANAASIDELLVKATSRPSILDPFKPYLGQRWNDGITSAAALHAGDPGPRLDRRHPGRRTIPASVPHRRRPGPPGPGKASAHRPGHARAPQSPARSPAGS